MYLVFVRHCWRESSTKIKGAFTLSGATPHATTTTTRITMPRVAVVSPNLWMVAPLECNVVTVAQVNSAVPSPLPPPPSKIVRGWGSESYLDLPSGKSCSVSMFCVACMRSCVRVIPRGEGLRNSRVLIFVLLLLRVRKCSEIVGRCPGWRPENVGRCLGWCPQRVGRCSGKCQAVSRLVSRKCRPASRPESRMGRSACRLVTRTCRSVSQLMSAGVPLVSRRCRPVSGLCPASVGRCPGWCPQGVGQCRG